jgi:hypothetical protein
MPDTAAVFRSLRALTARSFTAFRDDLELHVLCDWHLADFQILASSAKNRMPTSSQMEVI